VAFARSLCDNIEFSPEARAPRRAAAAAATATTTSRRP
jgi:hypothetical protein